MNRDLFNACQKADWSTAKWLASQNKGLDYVHVDGNTILHYAAKGNANILFVQLLLSKGANPNALNELGQTPVYLACANCASPKLVEMLLNANGDVNKTDTQGWSPLVAATFKNASPELILLLIERGADKGHVLKSGKSARDFAIEKKSSIDQPDLVHLIDNPSKQSIRPSSTRMLKSPSFGKIHSLVNRSIFISYSPGTERTNFEARKQVLLLVEGLKVATNNVYLSPEGKRSMLAPLPKELSTSDILLICITEEYVNRVLVGSQGGSQLDFISLEFTETMSRSGQQQIIPIIIEEKMMDKKYWKGPVGLFLHNTEIILQFMKNDRVETVVNGIMKKNL